MNLTSRISPNLFELNQKIKSKLLHKLDFILWVHSIESMAAWSMDIRQYWVKNYNQLWTHNHSTKRNWASSQCFSIEISEMICYLFFLIFSHSQFILAQLDWILKTTPWTWTPGRSLRFRISCRYRLCQRKYPWGILCIRR